MGDTHDDDSMMHAHVSSGDIGPNFFTGLQGKMSIEQAVRVLEGSVQYPHVGPEILLVDQNNIKRMDPLRSLAPASFSPIYKFP